MPDDRRIDEILERVQRLEKTIALTEKRLKSFLVDRIYSQVEALIGLHRELDRLPSLPPLRRWALSPDTARAIVEMVIENKPSHVLECGSGASSVLLGHLKQGGLISKVTCLEHDPVWYEHTRFLLRNAGLLDSVDLWFAPLIETEISNRRQRWYDIDAEFVTPIDILIVDGPPNKTGVNARWPALPLLISSCNPGCKIVLDDFARVEEQKVVEEWLEEFPVRLIRRDQTLEKWLAVLEYVPDAPQLRGE